MVESVHRPVVFRVDSSEEIGIGHVMRCLTLADALRSLGIPSHFICRAHPGHLGDYIENKGFSLDLLPCASGLKPSKDALYAPWLGAVPQDDIADCQRIMTRVQSQGLVVDHYAIDAQVHRALRPSTPWIAVIDDLADRRYDCDMLLDQTFGRTAQEYAALTPTGCRRFTGASFALLRPEFSAARPVALERRPNARLKNILVTMGGTDANNYTADVLVALGEIPTLSECTVRVVLGPHAPHANAIAEQIKPMAQTVELIQGAGNMAELMQISDFAIGAAGSTVWERCCLGLPGVIIVLADNQRTIAQNLASSGAVIKLEGIKTIDGKNALRSHVQDMMKNSESLATMSRKAAEITDGLGTQRIAHILKDGIL